MKKQILFFLSSVFILLNTEVKAQNYSLNLPETDSVGRTFVPEMKVYDRFGNSILLSDLVIPAQAQLQVATIPQTCTAGIFRLRFADAGTGQGFDDAVNGPARFAVACQVFSDLSGLLNAAGSPYSSISNLGTGNSFVEINVKTSLNNASDPTLGTAGQFFLTTSPGIVHGSVWQTINTGIDGWFALNGSNLGAPGLFHGEMQINFAHPFYLSLTNPAGIPSNQFDLYTVILHEAIHALGFGSLIDQNGNSKFTNSNPGIYSIYDTYLADAVTNTRLITTNGCYTAQFNTGFAARLTQSCSIRFNGTNSTFVSSDPVWSGGTSLSHYPSSCGNPGNYTMNPGLPSGLATRRHPELAEVTTLCDIGYSTTGTHAGFTYPSSGACGFRVAGVNDYATYSAASPGTVYTTVSTNPLQILSSDFLGNDENANAYDCLDVLVGGTISSPSAAGFTFNPTPSFSGVAILKYIPLNTTANKKGNITYIFINVTAPPLPVCPPSNCNLVCNGDFEAIINGNVAPLSNILITSGNTPDLYRAAQAGASIGIGCAGSTLPAPHVGGGNQFIAMAGFAGSNVETVFFQLIRTMQVGTTYNINFWARGTSSACTPVLNFIGSTTQPCNPPNQISVSGTTNCTAGSPVPPPFTAINMGNSTLDVVNSPIVPTTWRRYTFQYTPTSPINFVVVYPTTTAGPGTYVYFDDFEITEANAVPLTISSSVTPSIVCSGQPITYSFTICNNSTSTVNNIILQDILPSGIVQQAGGSFNFPTHTIPSLAPGACVTLTLNALVQATFGSLVNQLNVVSGGCVTSQSSTTVSVQIGVPTLTISKRVNNNTPTSGCTVLYSVDVCNTTSGTVNNIVIRDILPSGLIFVSSPNFIPSGVTLTSNSFSLPPGTITSPSCTTLVFTALVNGTVGTNITNCASAISGGFVCNNQPQGCVTITVQNLTAASCCVAPNKSIFNSNSVTEFGTGVTVTGQTIDIAGTFVINGNLTFNNCRLRMAPGSQINILSPNTLTITGASNIFSCTQMWNGIFVDPGASVIVNGLSTIEDAETAIVAKTTTNTATPANFTVDNSTLNKNFKHIVIQPFPGVHPGKIQNNAQLRCQISATSLGSTLKAPRTGQRTNIGVEITDVVGVSIVSPGIFNVFDNMDFGIFATNLNAANSSLIVQRNTFRNITGVSIACPFPGPCPPPPGIAIYTTGNLTNTLLVGGSSSTRNTFLTCFEGVEAHDYKNVTVNNNVFTNSTVGTIFRSLGAIAVSLIHNSIFPPGGIINVNSNNITNWNTGVRYFLNNQSILSNTTLNINTNSVTNSLSAYANNAVVVESVLPTVAFVTTNSWKIQSNSITNGTTGIRIRNIVLPPVDVLSNSVIMKTGGAPGGARYGIRLQNSNKINVANVNNITSSNNASNFFGISLEISQSCTIDNNRITGTGVGINCLGNSNFSLLKCNIMTGCRQGVLLNNATIGDQLPNGVVADNQWIGTINANSDIVDINSSSATIWTFRSSPSTYVPKHLFSLAITENKIFTSLPFNCPVIGPPCGGNPPICQLALAGLVQNNVLPTVFTPENQFMSNEFVFSAITNDNTLLNQGTPEDAVLQNFFDNIQPTVLGQLTNINASIGNNNISQAVSINSSVNPGCLIEQNQKSFNEVYLSTLASGINSFSDQQIATLTGIAQQCPLSGGRAVYQARTLLDYALRDVIDYDDDCSTQSSSRKKIDSPSVPVNKIVDGVNIQVYPNPANDNVTVTATIPEKQEGMVEIYSMVGSKIFSYILKEGNNKLDIPTTNFCEGVYQYKVIINGIPIQSDKLVIIK